MTTMPLPTPSAPEISQRVVNESVAVARYLHDHVLCGGGGDTLAAETGTVARGDWRRFGPFAIAEGESLVVVMEGSGDADLYVRKGNEPSTSRWDCRPYRDGTAEECRVQGPGDLHVGVRGYAASSDFSLTVSRAGH